MNKDNRDMEDISGKFRKWLLEKDKWGLPKRQSEMCSDTLEIGFFYGYTIAQKELEEQLRDAEKILIRIKDLEGQTNLEDYCIQQANYYLEKWK